MAHFGGGTFWGYREMARGGLVVSYWLPPMFMLWSPEFDPWSLQSLAHPAYDYRNFTGEATDEFPDEFTLIDEVADFQSSHFQGTTHRGALEMIFSYDGINPMGTRIVDRSFTCIASVRAFKVKNRDPGFNANYQLTFFR